MVQFCSCNEKYIRDLLNDLDCYKHLGLLSFAVQYREISLCWEALNFLKKQLLYLIFY